MMKTEKSSYKVKFYVTVLRERGSPNSVKVFEHQVLPLFLLVLAHTGTSPRTPRLTVTPSTQTCLLVTRTVFEPWKIPFFQ